MYKSKTYSYDYDDYEENNKNSETMVTDILSDAELPNLDEIIIGSWGESWEESSQKIIDDIIVNKDKFSNIKSLFIGDMDYEECEVSWILQGDYEKLFDAMPQLEKLTIKGSSELTLGKVKAPNLKSLTIICGGLPVHIIKSIQNAELPALEELCLYIGVEDYGFDGTIDDIEALLDKSNFPELKSLYICDSDIQDDITDVVLKCKYINQIEKLGLCYGSLTDKGGQLLLDAIPNLPNIKDLNLQYHFLSDDMMKKLNALPISVNTDEQNEPEEWDGQKWFYPMLTE